MPAFISLQLVSSHTHLSSKYEDFRWIFFIIHCHAIELLNRSDEFLFRHAIDWGMKSVNSMHLTYKNLKWQIWVCLCLTIEDVYGDCSWCHVSQRARVVTRILLIGVSDVQGAHCSTRLNVRFDTAKEGKV
jgi:hypothetical protein